MRDKACDVQGLDVVIGSILWVKLLSFGRGREGRHAINRTRKRCSDVNYD